MNDLKKIILLLPLLLFWGCNSDKAEERTNADLVIYSGHPTGLTNFYVKEFQERTGMKVQVVTGGGAEIIKLSEKKEKEVNPDIIMGVGADSLEARENLFLTYESGQTNMESAAYQSQSKKWVGDSIIPMVIIYNTQTVSANAVPESWQDLLNPRFKGQIAMGDPTVSGSTYTQLATILSVFGKEDAAWEFMQKLTENMEGEVLASSQDVPQKVSDGESMLGITLENYAYEYMQQGANIDFIYPLEGTSARASGIAIFKDSEHLDAAKTFIDFVLDVDVQKEVAIQYYRRPVRADIPLPSFMQDLSKTAIINYDYQWASDSAEGNLERWLELLSDVKQQDVGR